MFNVTIDQAIDIGYATFCAYKKDRLRQVLSRPNYAPLNEFFTKDKVILQGGDCIKGWISLGSTGNAKHISSGFEEDTHNVTNLVEELKVDWSQATTNATYDYSHVAMLKNDRLRIFRYIDAQRKNMFKEFADLLYASLWTTPTGSADKTSPHGIPAYTFKLAA